MLPYKLTQSILIEEEGQKHFLPSAIAPLPQPSYNPVMSTIPSVAQLHRAIKIAEQIQSLESELAAILGTASAPVTKSVAPTASAPKAKRKYTKKAAAVVSDGPTATDAVIHPLFGKSKRKYTKKAATSMESPAPAKKKGKMSAEGRAAIIAAQKARWAKVKKAKKVTAKEEAAKA